MLSIEQFFIQVELKGNDVFKVLCAGVAVEAFATPGGSIQRLLENKDGGCFQLNRP